MKLQPFTLEKQFRDYIWGGERLRPGHAPTAEVWAIHDTNIIADGRHAGRTLADLSEEYGPRLLGTKVTERIGNRFPVLIKLLDCNQWLSLQVHPNDAQAEELEGKGQFGKTEAWYFLDAGDQAEILCGTKPGVTGDDVARSVKDGSILEFTNRVPVHRSDYVLIPAGTIHALGPGLLVFEVQESSDITYRVFDWNRPASAGRKLHIEQSIRVIEPSFQAEICSSNQDLTEEDLVACAYFQLERLAPAAGDLSGKLNGETFHTLTVIQDRAQVEGDGWNFNLSRYDSLVLPACCGEYVIHKQPGCELLRVTA